MNVSLYIAKRYLLSKSSNNAINFISIIAAIGVILGSASLFIVLAGFAGLKDFTLEFSSLVDPDLKAVPVTGKSFVLSEKQKKELTNIEDIANYSQIIEERIIVSFDDKNYLASIKGVDENYQKVNNIDSVIQYGNWLTQNTHEIVVGWGISRNLSFGVLDYGKAVSLYVPKPGKGQITSREDAFNLVNAINVGIFDINENLNDTYVFAPISLAQDLLNYSSDQVSALEFKLKSETDEESVRNRINSVLGDKVLLKNRTQLNTTLYKMLNTENLAVYLIFTLVLIIALFNVIGSIIMMILDKKSSLNTLFNLGTSVKDIRKIFFIQGTLMSVFGGLIGIFLGLILVILQQQLSLIMITPSLPYPVSLKPMNFVLVFVTISVLGIIASKIASSRVTKTFASNYTN
ncbi:FtsX-like permease family protein [Yeosuana sp. MJ-SS3]|uniref:FtsX-like permease family protein n=1 Tax=Gilvirhabdus luticola TaxID=3079858 RepID=A0ABU3U2U7_9FLAO|nr:ABC transporter permease [Yeosuana sp. MJ-SS3]MDU8884720.1 FtsX-like permease family protein [Yeosuana sp. MJ-SS3]